MGRFRLGLRSDLGLINDRVKLLAYRIFDPTKPALLSRKPVDRTSEIAARAYELYQQRVHGESQQDQDWLQAEREIRDNAAAKEKDRVEAV